MINNDPCNGCIVDSMCKTPCEELNKYLTANIKKPHLKNINYPYIALLLRQGFIKLDLDYAEQWRWSF